MMFSFSTCHFVLFFLSLSLSANAETVRGSSFVDFEPESKEEAPVNLGVAGDYAILAKTGISTVPTSTITGNIGVSPIAATAMTGFSLTLHSGGQYTESIQILGQAHAASYGGAVATALTAAVSNMEAAYTDAAGRLNPIATRIDLGAGVLGANGINGGADAPLTTGVYTFGSGVTIAESITFDGGDTDVFIIQMTGNLMQVAGTKVFLTGGALAKNIFWQVAGHVTLEQGAHMEGILLVMTDVLMLTSSSMNGRVLAQTACNIQMATITEPPL
jgi:hypothetical protein